MLISISCSLFISILLVFFCCFHTFAPRFYRSSQFTPSVKSLRVLLVITTFVYIRLSFLVIFIGLEQFSLQLHYAEFNIVLPPS